MLRRFLTWLMARLTTREIYDGERLYLTRGYLLGGPRDAWQPARRFTGHDVTRGYEVRFKERRVNFMLHHFHRGDEDRELHNHPWRWALSIILAGGYLEERRVLARGRKQPCQTCRDGASTSCYVIKMRKVRPGRVNLIRADDFHRVQLLGPDCWSLFVAGPKTGGWGFWDRKTGRYTPWDLFVGARASDEAVP
jgi:hypothetical protein